MSPSKEKERELHTDNVFIDIILTWYSSAYHDRDQGKGEAGWEAWEVRASHGSTRPGTVSPLPRTRPLPRRNPDPSAEGPLGRPLLHRQRKGKPRGGGPESW